MIGHHLKPSLAIAVLSFFLSVPACAMQPRGAVGGTAATGGTMSISITINGTHVLSATLAQNESARAFADLLRGGDITVAMHDYGSFEKVGSLPRALPRTDTQITTEPGDIILYQGKQITMYYDVNSWNFTRLGKVTGKTPDELRAILGTGDVTATFSLVQ